MGKAEKMGTTGRKKKLSTQKGETHQIKAQTGSLTHSRRYIHVDIKNLKVMVNPDLSTGTKPPDDWLSGAVSRA